MTAREQTTVYRDGVMIWRGWTDRKPSAAKLAWLAEQRVKQARLIGGIPPENFWRRSA